MADLNRIEVNPDICSGKPVVRGTRVMVRSILSLLGEGYSFDQILAEFPSIEKEDISAAVAYASEILNEVRVLQSAA